MIVATPAEQRALPFRSIVSVTLAGLLCVGAIVWHHERAKSELMAMPAGERQSLYDRTLATLRTTCARADGEQLRGYCQQEAEFVSRFPECDASCQSTCQQYLPRPTK